MLHSKDWLHQLGFIILEIILIVISLFRFFTDIAFEITPHATLIGGLIILIVIAFGALQRNL